MLSSRVKRRTCFSAKSRSLDALRNGTTSKLHAEPVRALDQEHVVRVRLHELIETAWSGARRRASRRLRALLGPHDVDRRAGAILPAQDRVGAVLLEVEGARIATHGVRRVAVVPVSRARVGDFQPVAVVTL